MEHNYKHGEMIEITFNGRDWMREKFIGFTSDKHAVTEEQGYGGIRIRNNYRPIRKPTLIPWGPEDITPCMRLRHKVGNSNIWASAVNASNVGVNLFLPCGDFCPPISYVTYENLLSYWETYDGKPCGKYEVEK